MPPAADDLTLAPAGATPRPDAGLDRSLVGGIAWTGAMRWGTQLFGWAATIGVVRLLAPRDYGLVGRAMIYLGLV
ncbi:MAG: hypothetical protein ACREOE_11145, partial [Gemmatimonadales bacterium]